MTGTTTRTGDWTPDEILLTLEAHFLILEGASTQRVVAELAAELHRLEGPVRDAIRACLNVDTPDKNRGPSRVLVALSKALREDRKEVARLARNVRELWAQIRMEKTS